MSKWRHLFVDGEFAPRARLLAGLTLEQVTTRPPGAPHSIYEELWHVAKWQTVLVQQGERAAEEWVAAHQQFPSALPASEREWHELVEEFLSGVEEAVGQAQAPEAAVTEVRPGVTLTDVLDSLAVHDAYHLGKIVALRQAIGAWPPETK